MSLNSFKDWLRADESSPIDRSKWAMARGLGPDLPLPSLNSRDTVNPLVWSLLKKKGVVKDDGESERSEKKLDKEFGDKPDSPEDSKKK
jgi:hypothetical protein